MTAIHKAKLFRNGASQAVHLLAEFRFDGEEVFIGRHPTSGDVTLSSRPGALAWRKSFELAETAGDAGDYMKTRPLNTAPGERGVFDDEQG